MTTKTQKLVYKMLVTSTGEALCDSGGAYGRNWERNQKKTIGDFIKEPAVKISEDLKDLKKGEIIDDYYPVVSVFHYLSRYEIDSVCDWFNKLACDDWDSDIHGVSESQLKRLNKKFEVEMIGEGYNTYNGECPLTQTLQGQSLTINGDNYELIQIHQGCDVRGGYTDAKLFKKLDYVDFMTWDIYGSINGQDVSTCYDGVNLTSDDTDKVVPIDKNSKIELWLAEY